MTDDFATALENFTAEQAAETAAHEDRVIKGTVLKITATHVVVDVGFKSEGLVPIAEVQDHEGNVKVEPGQEIDVMIEKGETEEGYTKLSHQKASAPARLGRDREGLQRQDPDQGHGGGADQGRFDGGHHGRAGVPARLPGGPAAGAQPGRL